MLKYKNETTNTCYCCGNDKAVMVPYENHMKLRGREVRKRFYTFLGLLYFKTGVHILIGPLLTRKIKEHSYKRMIFCKGRIAVCVYCGHGQEVGKVDPYQVGLFYSDAYGTGAHIDKAIYSQPGYYLGDSRSIGIFDLINSSTDWLNVNTVLEIGGGPCHISR